MMSRCFKCGGKRTDRVLVYDSYQHYHATCLKDVLDNPDAATDRELTDAIRIAETIADNRENRARLVDRAVAARIRL